MKAERAQVFAEINITPLTDIFLVLLIIMMVVAPMLEYKQIDLSVAPSTESEETPPPTEDSKTVHLVIAADGSYTIDDTPVPATELVNEIQTRSVEKPEGLIIEWHPEARFDSIARAMDSAKVAGIEDITSAETQVAEAAPEAQPAAAPPAEKPAKAATKSTKSSKKK